MIITKENIPQKFQNLLYTAISRVTEDREQHGSYRGNGHHLAQEIVEEIRKDIVDFLPKDDVYDVTKLSTTTLKVIADIKKKNKELTDGLKWLIHQGCKQASWWVNREPVCLIKELLIEGECDSCSDRSFDLIIKRGQGDYT